MASLDGMENALNDLGEKSDRLARAVALDTDARLIKKTPRDTARAANNWNLAIGAADFSNLPEGEYPQGGDLALARAAGAASRIRAGDKIFVTNALFYIGPLEDGHSKQAPQGMIAVTVAEMDAAFPGIVREVRVTG